MEQRMDISTEASCFEIFLVSLPPYRGFGTDQSWGRNQSCRQICSTGNVSLLIYPRSNIFLAWVSGVGVTQIQSGSPKFHYALWQWPSVWIRLHLNQELRRFVAKVSWLAILIDSSFSFPTGSGFTRFVRRALRLPENSSWKLARLIWEMRSWKQPPGLAEITICHVRKRILFQNNRLNHQQQQQRQLLLQQRKPGSDATAASWPLLLQIRNALSNSNGSTNPSKLPTQ